MDARAVRRGLVVAVAVIAVAWCGAAALRGGAASGVIGQSGYDGAEQWAAEWRERAAGPGIVPFPQIGSVARDFALPLLHADEPWLRADTLALSDLRGRWVYLDVFGTWCGPCQEKYPDMHDVAREVEAAGGSVIGLLLEDRPRTAAAWFAEHGGMAYPFLVLDDETVRRWRIVGAPMGFLVSPDGRIARRCVGCAEEGDRVDDLAKLIRALDD